MSEYQTSRIEGYFDRAAVTSTSLHGTDCPAAETLPYPTRQDAVVRRRDPGQGVSSPLCIVAPIRLKDFFLTEFE